MLSFGLLATELKTLTFVWRGRVKISVIVSGVTLWPQISTDVTRRSTRGDVNCQVVVVMGSSSFVVMGSSVHFVCHMYFVIGVREYFSFLCPTFFIRSHVNVL